MSAHISRGVRNGNELPRQYFEWICSIACGSHIFKRGQTYSRLFRLLHDTEFTYLLRMDENRAAGGKDLRWRFCCAMELSPDTALPDELTCLYPCSVLEMMVALASYCEEHITGDPDVGDRTGEWFFEMLDNLGLSGMDDRHFDAERCRDILERFLQREYEPDGRGSLFILQDDSRDWRDMEIWYQMMEYLSENLYGGR